MNKHVLVGIVTYNPEIHRLLECLLSVEKQTESILIVDNGSINFCEIIEAFSYEWKRKITFIKNHKNNGIAKALDQIMNYARENNYEWVFTVDQDSVVAEGILDKYSSISRRVECQDVAMFSCLIRDRNFSDLKNEIQIKEILEVPYCITSGAYTCVKRYFETEGYDESFFIDCVDFDICYSLREIGYRICRINYEGLYHEVGHGENRKFFNKEIIVYHHKPFRVFFLARNTILMYKKHKKMFPLATMLKKELALLVRILLYEDEKKEKLNQFSRGIIESKLFSIMK